MKKLNLFLKFNFVLTLFTCFYNVSWAQFTVIGSQTDKISLDPITVNGIYIGKGLWASSSTNASAISNTAVGLNTLSNSSFGSYENTAIGYNVLNKSTIGGSNTGVGASVMSNLGNGTGNSAFGVYALEGTLLNSSPITVTQNTAIGASALRNLTQGADPSLNSSRNTAVGNSAQQYLSTGFRNTSTGAYSLQNGLIGSGNSAFGFESLRNCNDDLNSAFGMYSLNKLINGKNNVAVGHNAMFNALNGEFNVAIGSGAMGSLNTSSQAGSQNIAIGYNSMVGILGGVNNVCIGSGTTTPLAVLLPANVTTGNNQLSIQNCIWGINMSNQTNARLGIGVVPIATTVTSSVAIGTIAKLHVGGTLRIDNVPNIVSPAPANKYLYVDVNGFVAQATLPAAVGGVTSTCNSLNFVPKSNSSGNLLYSQIFDDGESVGINQTSNFNYAGGAAGGIIIPAVGTRFKLAVNGYTSSIGYVALSDKRFKKDIKTIPNPLDKIAKLGGYTYKWIESNSSGLELGKLDQAGFIAQEVLEVLPEAVIKREDGTLGLIYDAIMPLLAEGIKAQQKMIIDLQKLTIDQQSDLEKLKNEIQNLSDNSTSLRANNVNDNSVNLLNVSPNPIVGTSTISYTLKNIKAQSLIIVTDLQGKLIKKINLAQNLDKGTIELSMLEFPSSGMYLFSLISNNEEVQSKKIFVNK